MGDEQGVLVIVDALLRYLRVNPHAADTAEGIHRWWFEPDAQYTQDAVSRALDWLNHRRLIETTTAADGHQRFRRCATDEELAAALRSVAGGQTVPDEGP